MQFVSSKAGAWGFRFASHAIHSATQFSSFKIVYGFNQLTPLDLVPLPMHERGKKQVDFVRHLHDKVRSNIDKRTVQYAKHANKGRQKMVFELVD